MSEYTRKKELLLNNKSDSTWIKTLGNKDIDTDYFVGNINKIRQQMLLFKHVEYFKKFQKTHPEVYNKITSSFDVINYNISLDDNDTEFSLLKIVLSDLTKIRDISNRARRKLDDSMLAKEARELWFLKDQRIIEDIFFNLFFNDYIKNSKLEKNSIMWSNIKDTSNSPIRKIFNLFKKIPNIQDVNRASIKMFENLEKINDLMLENKKISSEVFIRLQSDMEVIEDYLEEKRKDIPFKELPVNNNMIYDLEKIPEFYLALSLFLIAPTQVNSKVMKEFSDFTETRASSEDKENAFTFIKDYYLSVAIDDKYVHFLSPELQQLRSYEKELGQKKIHPSLLIDKLNSLDAGFQHNTTYDQQMISEDIRGLAAKMKEHKLLFILKHTKPETDEKPRVRSKV